MNTKKPKGIKIDHSRLRPNTAKSEPKTLSTKQPKNRKWNDEENSV